VSLPSQYDGFLYALFDTPSKEGSITVLTLLARADLDPWKEASRLAALSTQEATTSLAATLCCAAGEAQNPLEADTTARRLVSLLPAVYSPTRPMSESVTAPSLRGSNFWLVWLCIQILLFMLVSAHGRAKLDSPSSTGDTKSELATKSALPSATASPALGATTRPEAAAASGVASVAPTKQVQ
jgi:hypothetical protein